MKKVTLTASLLALGIGVVGTPAVASDMQERFREEGKQIDLTRFLNAENDARSRSFLYGSVHEHDFTVEEEGTYIFSSQVPVGESEDYHVDVVLMNDAGNVVARDELNSNERLSQALVPGDYVLQVQGYKYGSTSSGGNSFYVTVAGQNVDQGVSTGDAIAFTGNRREGGQSAFVRRSDTVVAIAASNGSVSQEEPASSSNTNERVANNSADQASNSDSRQGFQEIVTDVKIRAKGEVLNFEMLEAGPILITTSTFGNNSSEYRIVAEVLNEQGQIVARDSGEGFDGDIDLRTELPQGRYSIRVEGQKFGGARSGVNNYELRVKRLDP